MRESKAGRAHSTATKKAGRMYTKRGRQKRGRHRVYTKDAGQQKKHTRMKRSKPAQHTQVAAEIEQR